jgi:hypothetical protein
MEETKKVEDKVELSKNQFDELNKRLKQLEKNNELLINIADKKALSQFYQRNQDDLPKEVNLREIDGKVVLGWRMIKDEVFFDPGIKTWIEDQQVAVLFEDGKKQEMSLTDFTRKYVLIPCSRIGIMKDERTGKEAFKLSRKDNGKEYTISVEYVN